MPKRKVQLHRTPKAHVMSGPGWKFKITRLGPGKYVLKWFVKAKGDDGAANDVWRILDEYTSAARAARAVGTEKLDIPDWDRRHSGRRSEDFLLKKWRLVNDVP